VGAQAGEYRQAGARRADRDDRLQALGHHPLDGRVLVLEDVDGPVPAVGVPDDGHHGFPQPLEHVDDRARVPTGPEDDPPHPAHTVTGPGAEPSGIRQLTHDDH
jgi:hypothetical protein